MRFPAAAATLAAWGRAALVTIPTRSSAPDVIRHDRRVQRVICDMVTPPDQGASPGLPASQPDDVPVRPRRRLSADVPRGDRP